MPPFTIFCPGGENSQTGESARERYPKTRIESCGDSIKNVLSQLESNPGPYVIPIWNSHHGEIGAASFVWDGIEGATIRLSDLWAKSIQFWFVRRTGDKTSHGEIGSVPVAATQCSGFLQERGVTLKQYSLTTVAFTEYRKGAMLDGVLVAPGQGEGEQGFEVVSKKTANPNNFTSFVRLVPSRAFTANGAGVRSWLTGIRMPSFGASLGDAEQEFFNQLLDPVRDLSDLPKLAFVFDRDARVGLLFEGARLQAGDLLDAEQLESGDISIYENAGALRKFYTDELKRLFSRKFPSLVDDDFILHRGVDTCLFACPPLGLFTHGYKVTTVEPVVRFYISKLFELWDNDVLKCTPSQSEFFERYKAPWRERRSEFIQFTTISPTGR